MEPPRIESVFQDLKYNSGRPIIQLTLVLFRIANLFRSSSSPIIKLLGVPVAVAYRAFALTVAHIDLPAGTSVGRRLRIHHGTALVVNRTTLIGDDVVLRHSTTLGAKANNAHGPQIGNNVDIGPHSIVIGDIKIGADAIIGAGSVVIHDVAVGCTVAGNPARAIITGSK